MQEHRRRRALRNNVNNGYLFSFERMFDLYLVIMIVGSFFILLRCALLLLSCIFSAQFFFCFWVAQLRSSRTSSCVQFVMQLYGMLTQQKRETPIHPYACCCNGIRPIWLIFTISIIIKSKHGAKHNVLGVVGGRKTSTRCHPSTSKSKC